MSRRWRVPLREPLPRDAAEAWRASHAGGRAAWDRAQTGWEGVLMRVVWSTSPLDARLND
jgi:hypothetical protein